tara:strand:+ start:243 stop:539 length:297 start_codon:yes stop_codon:yes gene_type:complete
MTQQYHYYVTKWKSGEYPEWDYPVTKFEVLRAVVYDQTTHLYTVEKDELDNFDEWVAMQWACENEPQGEEETNAAFFERMDIQIIKRPSITRKQAEGF